MSRASFISPKVDIEITLIWDHGFCFWFICADIQIVIRFDVITLIRWPRPMNNNNFSRKDGKTLSLILRKHMYM